MSKTFNKVGLASTSRKDISISEIDLGDRSRITYDKIDELAKDIKSVGLINDICIMFRPGKKFLLLAGGRRLAAVIQIGWVVVPCKVYEQLTPIQVMIVELAENLNRENLSPVTIIQQRAKIFKLMHADNLEQGKKAPTLDKIAKVLGCDKSTLSRDLQMASAIEQHPEITKDASSRKDIANSINKIATKEIMNTIASRQETLDDELDVINKKPVDIEEDDDTETVLDKRIVHLLKNFQVADTFKTCERLIANKVTVNLVEIDPPYAIEYDKIKQSDENTETYHEVKEEDYFLFMQNTLQCAYDLLPESGWAVCWYAINRYYEMVLRLARATGFATMGIPAIWTKPNSTGQNNQPKINLSSTYETFLVLRKGKAFLNKNARANEFRYPVVKQKTHATEKPVELYEDIYDTLVPKGSHIISMFAGSGASIVAGFLRGMQVLGIDDDKAHKVSYEGLLRKYMKV